MSEQMKCQHVGVPLPAELRAFVVESAMRAFVRKTCQASYLNERATRVRNAVTFPFSTFMSIFTTSAKRRSRIEVAAVSTARRPASSHDVLLSPTTSTIR
jgi:hypothetical protein